MSVAGELCMTQQNQSRSVAVTPPSLPKGGGALPGMGEALGNIGPSGLASLSIPLPVSAGRGYGPDIGLSYSSSAGNGVFGLGWGVNIPYISRRTSQGVPQYTGQDEFLAPGGEVLMPERDENGQVITTTCAAYGEIQLNETWQVVRYSPRIEGTFTRIESWQHDTAQFWLLHGTDGQLHCFGKNANTQIADPDNTTHIAVWMLEESVSPGGEHIHYRYQPETTDGIAEGSVEASRDCRSQRYLVGIDYSNVVASPDLYAWQDLSASQHWLFTLVFDYGERGMDPDTAPLFTATGPWTLRQDPFSRYDYGFEIRTHRLCQQVLMFHHFPDELAEEDTLVSCLRLEYQQDPRLTVLVGAQSMAWDDAGTVQCVPPLDLRYNTFEPRLDADQWQPFDAMPGVDESPFYQLVDLFGEGLPGILYRAGQQWRYRAPERGSAEGDSVSYSAWQPLPWQPSLQPAKTRLMDITGNGKLDWLVTQPGLAGFFSLSPDAQWSNFTAFNTLPSEFFHTQAQLVDLTGDGLSDLAMIGPKSVRFYGNLREGFAPALTVSQRNDLTVAGRDARELVAFSDVLGSGQLHLVRIRYNDITVWPNLGGGVFAAPFQLAALDFDEQTFNPEQVLLADLDGSGTADLLYRESDQLRIWFNQSGNSLSAPVTLPLPEGTRYDRLCQVSAADVQGQGMASLIFSLPHPTPQHWRYDFATAKPWLLSGTNNNMGGDTSLIYRSSAQEWLDEKKENTQAVSQLPFPVHIVSQVVATDEITGNILTQQYRYRKGVYDGNEREFRGFGYLELQDSQRDWASDGSPISFTPPLLTKGWYHTGQQQDEASLYGTPYQDPLAFAISPTYFSEYSEEDEMDIPLQADDTDSWWLYRALKGQLLRSESYGLDGGDQENIPYQVSLNRYLVRRVQVACSGQPCVALVAPLEQWNWGYERLAVDPQVSQHVTIQRDEFATPLWSVNLNYPRRDQPADNPYPDTLPPTTWQSSYDDQQTFLRISEQRCSVYHLVDSQAWRLGLAHQQRQNFLSQPAWRGGGLRYEDLISPDGLLGHTQPRTFAGQSEVIYQGGDAPDFTALVDHCVVAELDDAALAAYDGALESEALQNMLLEAGYIQTERVLEAEGADEALVWAIEQGFTTFKALDGFYRPVTVQSTVLTGPTTFVWDDYNCLIVAVTDALGNTMFSAADYRFLQPWQGVDINDNTREVQRDALGNLIATTFYGSGQGVATGFDSLMSSPVTPGQSVADVIASAGQSIQPQASRVAYDLFSWMGQVIPLSFTSDEWQRLVSLRFLTPQGFIRSAGHQWLRHQKTATGLSAATRQILGEAKISPVQVATLTADRYPDDCAQQVRVAVAYQDGFGRPLQACGKVSPGEAWQRDADGELVVDENGQPVIIDAATRWAVSGRVEYDNKGLVVRQYQPGFVDDWQYVKDCAMRAEGYADDHYYDALGRENKVITAKGYLRKKSYYPWFVVSEDENDTLTA